MLSCRLTIKIKDYFPKVTSIPYINYICLFTCGEYQGQIPFLPDKKKLYSFFMVISLLFKTPPRPSG